MLVRFTKKIQLLVDLISRFEFESLVVVNNLKNRLREGLFAWGVLLKIPFKTWVVLLGYYLKEGLLWHWLLPEFFAT